jgi:signal transduction histidine kinase
MLVRSEGMSGLVEQVLSATAAGLTTAAATPEPFDLAAVTRAASRSLAGASAAHPLTVHAEAPVAALGRPETVAALLDQLVENAVKYSPDGGAVAVHVRAEPDAAVLSVADRGRGIRPADVERVFERFQRGQQSAGGPSGAGLGLWIVRRTVEAQGGSVSAAPRDGGGTVVTVRLPRGDHPGSPAAVGD